MKRHLRWWRSFHISHASDKVGGGDTLGAGEEAPPCSESFSLHVNWRCSCSSLHDAMLRSFSGEGSAFWSLSLWAFSSSSELKLVPQGSHLGYKTTNWLLLDSAWQKARHFSTSSLSIFCSHFPERFWTKNFPTKWESNAHRGHIVRVQFYNTDFPR